MKSLPTTSDFIKKYHLSTKKSLGQNFILDKSFTDKIISKIGDIRGDNVLEIGPGPGCLSRSILDGGVKKLISIEKDQRCVNALKELQDFYGEKFIVAQEDALEVDELNLYGEEKFRIIANLPYNIGTVLLFKWLKIASNISSMYLMLQKEVVDRITAQKGEKNYGRLAVMISFLCETRNVMNVGKHIFNPPPKVVSAIVEIIPRDKPLFDVDFAKLELVTRTCFAQRRKMIKSSLKGILKDPGVVLNNIGIDTNLRPENLSIEEFCKIAQKL